MSRAVAEAVERLRARGTLGEAQATLFGRTARRELVSVRWEVQAALWAGVTMIAGGAGLLVRKHFEDLGPATIAAGIGLAAAACLGYVARRSPPFSWGAVASPTLAFDYALLLAALLLGSELAYLETQYDLLGPAWPRHLLLLALVQAALAFRFDSRAVLALALASFAAWRGVSLSFPIGQPGAGADEIRVNALAVGALYLGLGALLERAGRKAHFESTLGNAGLLLLLGAPVTEAMDGGSGQGAAWLALLAALACGAIALGLRARRSDYFAQGVAAAFIGFVRLLTEAQIPDELNFLLIAAASFGALFLVLRAHRSFREGP